MRRKLLLLALLASTVTVSRVQATDKADKEVCWKCDFCAGTTCYGCRQVICPIGVGGE